MVEITEIWVILTNISVVLTNKYWSHWKWIWDDQLKLVISNKQFLQCNFAFCDCGVCSYVSRLSHHHPVCPLKGGVGSSRRRSPLSSVTNSTQIHHFGEVFPHKEGSAKTLSSLFPCRSSGSSGTAATTLWWPRASVRRGWTSARLIWSFVLTQALRRYAWFREWAEPAGNGLDGSSYLWQREKRSRWVGIGD